MWCLSFHFRCIFSFDFWLLSLSHTHKILLFMRKFQICFFQLHFIDFIVVCFVVQFLYMSSAVFIHPYMIKCVLFFARTWKSSYIVVFGINVFIFNFYSLVFGVLISIREPNDRELRRWYTQFLFGSLYPAHCVFKCGIQIKKAHHCSLPLPFLSCTREKKKSHNIMWKNVEQK